MPVEHSKNIPHSTQQSEIPSEQNQFPEAPSLPKEENDAATDNLKKVFLRNEFYKDGYRTLLKVATIEGITIIGLILAIFFVIHTHQPENRFFATTEDGRLIPMVALSQSNLSTPALMSWVAQSATEVMTFNYNDYQQSLQESSRNFTRKGWGDFTNALDDSRIIEMVKASQQIVTATPRGAPILKAEGLANGRYQWLVEIPMTITYKSRELTRSDNMIVTLTIVRVPRLESPNGVGIEQWLAKYG